MSGIVLVVGNGNWPSQELVDTLIDSAEFVIALDGAADRFDSWDVVVGDLDSISNPEDFEGDSNQENSDLAKALIQYEVDAVVGIEGGRVDHRIAAFTSLFEAESDAILYFDDWRACRVGVGGLEIELPLGTKCSLMPFGNVSNVTLEGTYFELQNQNLSNGTKGVGNKTKNNLVSISHETGDLLFIWEANAP